MSLIVTILGCGSSGGVPRVGQGWGACDPADPKNRRRRCSILIEQTDPATGASTSVVVDTSPDLRAQLLDAGVTRLDGVILTHQHADHTHGIDDLRPLVIHNHQLIDIFMDAVTAEVMLRRFDYIFHNAASRFYSALCIDRRIADAEGFVVKGPGGALGVTPFRVEHGDIDALGLRFGDIAYTPDLVAIPEASLPFLAGLDVWIIDALRHTPHPTHFSLPQALAWIDRLQPRRAVLTNMHTDLDYATLQRELPAHVIPAYDGLRLTFGAS